jgi:hypothetical protein
VVGFTACSCRNLLSHKGLQLMFCDFTLSIVYKALLSFCFFRPLLIISPYLNSKEFPKFLMLASTAFYLSLCLSPQNPNLMNLIYFPHPKGAATIFLHDRRYLHFIRFFPSRPFFRHFPLKLSSSFPHLLTHYHCQ